MDGMFSHTRVLNSQQVITKKNNNKARLSRSHWKILHFGHHKSQDQGGKMPIVLITYMRSTKKRVELIMQKCKTKKELTLGR